MSTTSLNSILGFPLTPEERAVHDVFPTDGDPKSVLDLPIPGSVEGEIPAVWQGAGYLHPEFNGVDGVLPAGEPAYYDRPPAQIDMNDTRSFSGWHSAFQVAYVMKNGTGWPRVLELGGGVVRD